MIYLLCCNILKVEKGEIMTTEKCKDSKYVFMVCMLGALLVLGSAINNFNILDIIYLIFIFGCLVRYIYINVNN